MLTYLATSARVVPGLLTWQAWQALTSADAVFAPPEHPLLPVLDEAGLRYQVVPEAPGIWTAVAEAKAGREVMWLAQPGAEDVRIPVSPVAAQILYGSADLPGAKFLDLVATMDRLRTGCPWDAKQTHDSLAPHLLEEPYEALEALELGDQRAFREELGDVLLQVVFHARIAAENEDGYTIDDVVDGIVSKLVRRHPHVFGDVTVSDADEVKRNWDEIKKQEKKDLAERSGVPADEQLEPSALDGVPFGQPALALAAQLQRRAARAGIPAELAQLDEPAPRRRRPDRRGLEHRCLRCWRPERRRPSCQRTVS